MLNKLLYALVLVSLLIPVYGCQNFPGSPPPIVTDTEATFPFYFTLEMSKIPQPGETAELTFFASLTHPSLLSTDKPKEGLANGKVWLDFYWTNINGSYYEASHGVLVPLSEVLVNGETSRQGNVRETGTIKSTIKLPREGIWKIVGNAQGEGWAEPETITKMYVIADGYGFNYGFTPNPDLADSSLSYLQYFNYGYYGTRERTVNENNRIIQELDISKAPKVGETATITVKITSLHDISGFSSDIRFYNNTLHEVIPGENLYIDGDLSWSGDLKANKLVQYSVDIKFPEEGEWKIGTGGAAAEISLIMGDSIELTISEGRSFFGWKPLPIIESSGPSPKRASKNPYTGEVEIPNKVKTTQPEIEQPEEPAPFNWLPVIIVVPVAVVLSGIISYLLVRRRRKSGSRY